jgi:hypothetical protein
MYLENEWLYPTIQFPNLIWKLSQDAENRIRQEHNSWTDERLKSNLLESTFRLGKTLGDNIFVSLSGGIDSQTACLALQQSGISFTAVILVFDENFNEPDVSSAINFCNVNNIKYVTIDIDIMKFLTRELIQYADKYQCPSPQISTHLWFYEQVIKHYNPSSIVCGGNVPYLHNGGWVYWSSRAQSAWMTFKDVNNFNIIGNFKGHSFDIAIAFMLACKNTVTEVKGEHNRFPLLYSSKIQSMYNLGFNVIPQSSKLTGFEDLKIMLKDKVKQNYVFDKWFRYPLEKRLVNYASGFELNTDITNILSSASENLEFLKTRINTY